MASNLVPKEALEPAFEDNYDEFLNIRSRYIHKVARALVGSQVKREIDPEEIDDSDSDPTQ